MNTRSLICGTVTIAAVATVAYITWSSSFDNEHSVNSLPPLQTQASDIMQIAQSSFQASQQPLPSFYIPKSPYFSIPTSSTTTTNQFSGVDLINDLYLFCLSHMERAGTVTSSLVGTCITKLMDS